MSQTGESRVYNSPLRERQAQETRATILDAAERLFPSRGFARTRLVDVATEAGVSLATVKLIFGTKQDLLLTLWHRTLAGGADDKVPVADRPWFRVILDDDDPEAAVRRLAAVAVMVRKRIMGLFRVIEEAAAADPDIAELTERMGREYYANQRSVIESLGRHLRPELGHAEATDILFTLNSGHTYYSLVHIRGWTPEKYEQWLADILCRELLRSE